MKLFSNKSERRCTDFFRLFITHIQHSSLNINSKYIALHHNAFSTFTTLPTSLLFYFFAFGCEAQCR